MLKVFERVGARAPSLTRSLRGARPETASTLEEKLASRKSFDHETEARVDIGFFKDQDIKSSYRDRSQRASRWQKFKLNQKLQEAARNETLRIDYNQQAEFWYSTGFGKDMAQAADHYGVFRSLFEYGYFYPVFRMRIGYPTSEDNCNPVHMGNILLPSETVSPPDVSYPAESDDLFTLVLTSLDSHLESSENEYLHWMIGNIPGNDISKGETVCDYMQPFMPKGTGYHRYAFVLYKQNKKVDFASEKRTPNSVSLRERTFRTIDFYRERQDCLTPCSLSFFQSKWDDSLMDFFHNTLDMKVPIFEYLPEEEKPEPIVKYPEGKAFNEYLDQYRDPKEIAQEIYCRRLKKINPFEEEPPPLKYPYAQFIKEKTSWVRLERVKEQGMKGRYRHLKKFSIYPENEPVKYKGPYKLE